MGFSLNFWGKYKYPLTLFRGKPSSRKPWSLLKCGHPYFHLLVTLSGDVPKEIRYFEDIWIAQYFWQVWIQNCPQIGLFTHNYSFFLMFSLHQKFHIFHYQKRLNESWSNIWNRMCLLFGQFFSMPNIKRGKLEGK